MTGSWVCSSPLDRRLLGGDDADALLVARSMAEFDSSVSGGEQGVVAAHPDVLARIERAATLPDDDRAGMHLLAVAALHAQALPDRVPAVLAGAPSLLVGHRPVTPSPWASSLAVGAVSAWQSPPARRSLPPWPARPSPQR